MKVQKYMPPRERPEPKEQLRDVANMYEKHFLRQMVKAMRSTVQESGFIQTNHAEKIFREQLDDQYVESWGKQGGVGFSDLIYNQLIEKFGAQLGIKEQVAKPQGPIAVKIQDQQQQSFRKQEGNKEKISYEFSLAGAQNPEARVVQNPWSGKLTKKIELRPDEHLLEVEHKNGLKSQIMYQGRVSQIEIGKELQGGESLGTASPDSSRLIWNVSSNLGQTRPQNQQSVSE
ncbi:MAG: rod-binding protein [Bdellovibrionia bacterium]